MSKDDQKNDNQNSQNEDGQVIEFPLERLKAKRKAQRLADRSQKQKKATLFLSVASLFLFAAYMNQNSSSDLQNLVQREGMERMVANSKLSDEEINQRNEELASSLDESSRRQPASYGRKPTAIEILKHDKLNGRYRMAFTGERLGALVLDESGGVKQSPIRIGSPKSFLYENKSLLGVDFDEIVERASSVDDQGHVNIAYSLVGKSDKDSEKVIEKVRVFFLMDATGERLIQMLVQEDRQNY